MGREARLNKGKRKARELAAQSFTPDQLRQILEAANSATLVEVVGVKCLHHLTGGVMSVETYLSHLSAGCKPLRVADNIRDLTRARDSREDADGSRH